MNLQRLSIFRSVYETLSVSRSGAELRLAQPTVSRHLRIFEDEVGLKLFVNVKGRLKPTREADVLYHESAGAFEKVDQIEATIGRLKTGEGETLRIMAVPSLLAYEVLPNAIAEVKRVHPHVHIEIDIGGGATQVRALREGTTHVGLAAGVRAPAGLSSEKVGEGEIVAIVPRDHALADRSELPLEMLAELKCVMPSRRGPVGKLLLDTLARRGIVPPRFITAVSPALATGLVSTLKCCAISDNFASSLFAHHDLKTLPLSERVPFDVQLLIRPDQVVQAPLDLFLDFLRSELRRVTGLR